MNGTPGLPPELQPLQAGDPAQIGEFRIVGRLGAGAMGTVFGGVAGDGRCLAVKTGRPDLAADPGFRAAFAREVELWGRVDAMCVPKVRAADPEAALPWMAEDFAPGHTLQEHLARRGPLSGDMLVAFAAGTAEALAAMHGAGVIHRGITPGHVILAPDGPRIVDFDLARPAGAGGEAPEAAPSSESPGWVAPERHSGAEPTPSAAMFAWGALVATGREPFGTGTDADLRERVLGGQADLEGVPEELRGVVTAALSTDPAQRPDAGAALRQLLVHATGESGQAAASPAAQHVLLRGLLALRWRGISAADHDPATWAALGGVPEAATRIEVSAPVAAPPVPAAPQGPAKTRAGLLSGKGVIIAAAAVVAVGLLAGGAYAASGVFGGSDPAPEEASAEAEDSPEDANAESEGAPDPEEMGPGEAIAHAAELVLAAESFEAETLQEPIDQSDVDAARNIFFTTHQYTGSPEPIFVESRGRGRLDSYVYLGEDQLFAFSPMENAWRRLPADDTVYDGASPPTPEGFVQPMLLMAEADDLTVLAEEEEDGVSTVLYGGTFTLPVPTGVEGGAQQYEDRVEEFQIRLDENGLPVRAFYAQGEIEFRTEFESFDAPVDLDYPYDEFTADPSTIPEG